MNEGEGVTNVLISDTEHLHTRISTDTMNL